MGRVDYQVGLEMTEKGSKPEEQGTGSGENR
jgi:hypothetical protein